MRFGSLGFRAAAGLLCGCERHCGEPAGGAADPALLSHPNQVGQALLRLPANCHSCRRSLLRVLSRSWMAQVKQLARLSLDNPEYVSVHENAEAPTPAKLEQVTSPHHPAPAADAYSRQRSVLTSSEPLSLVPGPMPSVELQDKLSVLWSFIRTHLKVVRHCCMGLPPFNSHRAQCFPDPPSRWLRCHCEFTVSLNPIVAGCSPRS